ncbi:DNA polymerase III subunit delta [Proteiniborus sp. DW1]|uniref:DNA polymerase III subunit delta n=1 Tax=Proteiniborus sp. DW1 TaxID=1889883 RepID=UPI00092DFD88|nr:DNA polymerase III subunit delta [Proteiniborus sp. DW1]SCG83639.1 DNA polymerase III subunit delta [Proteiniborus sp. DW1]
MDYKEMLKDIKNDELKNVYLLYGNEMYLKDYIISNIKQKYIDVAFESLNMIYIDGKETTTDKIINACETLPFMSDKKIVVVEDLPLFTTKKETNNLDEDELCNYLGKLNSSTCLLFVLNEVKIDNRKKVIKIIKQNGEIVQLLKLRDAELIKWTQSVFSRNKKSISNIDIQFFLHQAGYYDSNNERTLYDLENEINKICSYLGQRKIVEKEDIEKGVVKSLQNNVFALVDAIGEKKVDEALSIFNDMILDNEPIQLIFHMIIRQLRLLMLTKLYGEKGYSQGDISQKINVPTFVVKKLLMQTKNFSSTNLNTILEKALDVDRTIKTGKMEWSLAVEMFISEISNLY